MVDGCRVRIKSSGDPSPRRSGGVRCFWGQHLLFGDSHSSTINFKGRFCYCSALILHIPIFLGFEIKGPISILQNGFSREFDFGESMASSTKPHIHDHFRQIIWYSLDNNLVNNALFVAERLLALNDRDQDSRHLLGLCLLRAGRASSAYNITNGFRHLGCSYIFAQSCKEMGKYREGILSLETALSQVPRKWSACT
jgi:hypothetical protein